MNGGKDYGLLIAFHSSELPLTLPSHFMWLFDGNQNNDHDGQKDYAQPFVRGLIFMNSSIDELSIPMHHL